MDLWENPYRQIITLHLPAVSRGKACFPCETFSMPKKSKMVKVIIL